MGVGHEDQCRVLRAHSVRPKKRKVVAGAAPGRGLGWLLHHAANLDRLMSLSRLGTRLRTLRPDPPARRPFPPATANGKPLPRVFAPTARPGRERARNAQPDWPPLLHVTTTQSNSKNGRHWCSIGALSRSHSDSPASGGPSALPGAGGQWTGSAPTAVSTMMLMSDFPCLDRQPALQ